MIVIASPGRRWKLDTENRRAEGEGGAARSSEKARPLENLSLG